MMLKLPMNRKSDPMAAATLSAASSTSLLRRRDDRRAGQGRPEQLLMLATVTVVGQSDAAFDAAPVGDERAWSERCAAELPAAAASLLERARREERLRD